MKAIRPLVLILFCLLFMPAVADAQQPIPGIKQTGQWKSMKNYVSFLQSRQSTLATPAEKQTFTSQLANKQLATNAKVKALYSRSIQRIVNRDQRAEKKQIKKIRRGEKSQLNQLRGQRARAIGAAQLRWAANNAAIRSQYSSRISKAKKNLRSLQRALKKTSNPFRRATLVSHINTVTEKISLLAQGQKTQLQNARQAYQIRVSKIRRKFAAQATDIRARYQRLVVEVKNSWKKIYRNDLRAAKERRQGQFQLVTNLRRSGNEYIAAMPPA